MLRRLRRGRFAVRMRPHYVLGYGALILAAFHTALSSAAASGANRDGLWLAALALVALALQAFVGSSLQAPGLYRLVLRRWHLGMFCASAGLICGHVLLNGAL